MTGPGNKPLLAFLARNNLPQARFAQAIGVARETVNRWIHRGTTPTARTVIAALALARTYEPEITLEGLFGFDFGPADPKRGAPSTGPDYKRLCYQLLELCWGRACSLCKIPWDVESEHLPLSVLNPDLGFRPNGDLCESCARRMGAEFLKCSAWVWGSDET